MTHHSWRDSARPIIERVLAETKGLDEKAIKKALHDAYPFHERAMYPYKVWCDEIRRQRGQKRTMTRKKKSPQYAGESPWQTDLDLT